MADNTDGGWSPKEILERFVEAANKDSMFFSPLPWQDDWFQPLFWGRFERCLLVSSKDGDKKYKITIQDEGKVE